MQQTYPCGDLQELCGEGEDDDGSSGGCWFGVEWIDHVEIGAVVKTLPVLCGFTVVFAALTLGVVWMRPNDGQLYTLFSSLLTGYAGALLLFLTGKSGPPPTP